MPIYITIIYMSEWLGKIDTTRLDTYNKIDLDTWPHYLENQITFGYT